jgi:hypothetical protein
MLLLSLYLVTLLLIFTVIIWLIKILYDIDYFYQLERGCKKLS